MGKLNTPYNHYELQIVYPDGVRLRYSSVPRAFPSTAEGLRAMREGLVKALDQLDNAIVLCEKVEAAK